MKAKCRFCGRSIYPYRFCRNGMCAGFGLVDEKSEVEAALSKTSKIERPAVTAARDRIKGILSRSTIDEKREFLLTIVLLAQEFDYMSLAEEIVKDFRLDKFIYE